MIPGSESQPDNAALQQAVDPNAMQSVQTDPAATAVSTIDPNSMQAVQTDPAAAATSAPAADPNADPWAALAGSYGLGAPPAQGLPATLTPTNIGAAPQTTAALIDPNGIPQATASQIDPNAIQQPGTQQMGISDEIKAMAGGQGYSPDVIAKMKAAATQNAASAGTQQMGQAKRYLGQNGISGGANAAVLSDIARQTGQNQSTALGNIDIKNADVGNSNAQFGIGQETSIGENNMQAANAMALANANRMFSGLQANQSSNNQTSQFNAGQGFTAQKSNQDSQNQTNQMNTGLTFQRQNDQATMNNNTEKDQWDELNKRYGQAQNILGSWGAAA